MKPDLKKETLSLKHELAFKKVSHRKQNLKKESC